MFCPSTILRIAELPESESDKRKQMRRQWESMMNSVTEELIHLPNNRQEREKHVTKELKTGQYL